MALYLYYWANLFLGIVSLLLFFQVYNTYKKNRNKLSLYFIVYFILSFFGYTASFISSPIVLDRYEEFRLIFLAISTIAITDLLLFAYELMEVNMKVRIGIATTNAIFYFLYVLSENFITVIFLLIIPGMVVIVVLGIIYKRQKDIKTLGLFISQISLLIGNGIVNYFQDIGGIIIFVGTLALLLAFLSKSKSK